jgi:flagellar hook-basal body complex protein FliE
MNPIGSISPGMNSSWVQSLSPARIRTPMTDAPAPGIDVGGPQSAAGANSFSNLLGELSGEVSAKSATASQKVGAMLAGENVPLHQAMIAMEEASVSFQLMVEVRNKLLESYHELMRMQV